MAPSDMDLGVVDCELAELELDETFPAATVVIATVAVESEVEVDEGACGK